MRWRRCCAGAGARTGAPGGATAGFRQGAGVDRQAYSVGAAAPEWVAAELGCRCAACIGCSPAGGWWWRSTSEIAGWICARRRCAVPPGRKSWPASVSTGVSPITAISRPLSSSVSACRRASTAGNINKSGRGGPAPLHSIADADRFGFGVGIQPIRPKSRPLPDCLNPPNGMFGSISVWVLTHTVPA